MTNLFLLNILKAPERQTFNEKEKVINKQKMLIIYGRCYYLMMRKFEKGFFVLIKIFQASSHYGQFDKPLLFRSFTKHLIVAVYAMWLDGRCPCGEFLGIVVNFAILFLLY
jgi:hypothetical protein